MTRNEESVNIKVYSNIVNVCQLCQLCQVFEKSILYKNNKIINNKSVEERMLKNLTQLTQLTHIYYIIIYLYIYFTNIFYKS